MDDRSLPEASAQLSNNHLSLHMYTHLQTHMQHHAKQSKTENTYTQDRVGGSKYNPGKVTPFNVFAMMRIRLNAIDVSARAPRRAFLMLFTKFYRQHEYSLAPTTTTRKLCSLESAFHWSLGNPIFMRKDCQIPQVCILP